MACARLTQQAVTHTETNRVQCTDLNHFDTECTDLQNLDKEYKDLYTQKCMLKFTFKRVSFGAGLEGTEAGAGAATPIDTAAADVMPPPCICQQ